MGNGHFVFGCNNKLLAAVLLVLSEAMDDKNDYIGWWLYNLSDDYNVSLSDGSKTWNLKKSEALYDFLINDCK